MKLDSKTEIVIRQILKSNGEIKFVEFYSPTDSRNHILNVERFCIVFGYSMEDLKKI